MRSYATQLIQPFPLNINRDVFGNWLSGFADGEGCFIIAEARGKGSGSFYAHFQIEIRDDDADVLRLIQSFWQCGPLYARRERKDKGIFCNPTASLIVTKWDDLSKIVVPHFRNFPLRAKKARDFLIWENGVSLGYRASRGRRVIHADTGRMRQWSQENAAVMIGLIQAMKLQRAYQSKPVDIPRKLAVLQKGLFDE